MSKLIDKLLKVSQPQPQAMGFKAVKAEPRPKIQLIANLSTADVKELPAADAVILNAPESRNMKSTWGVRGAKDRLEEIDQLIKSGADFAILSTNGEVLPADRKIGKVLEIEGSITDILLRTVAELPVDAVFLSNGELVVTYKRLMLIQRFASLVNKPLLVEVPPDIRETHLQLIWETGVSGVVVTVDAEQAEAVTKNLRKVIDKLSYPSRRKRDKSVVTLPHVVPPAEESDEGEEEEDE